MLLSLDGLAQVRLSGAVMLHGRPFLPAQRVEIRSRNELNISGCRVELIRTLATSNGSEAAALVVPGRAPEWRPKLDEIDKYESPFLLR